MMFYPISPGQTPPAETVDPREIIGKKTGIGLAV